MRRIQTDKSIFKRHSLTAIGDSQTDFLAFYGVAPESMWTSQLSKRLNRLGALTVPRAFGVSGDTTSMMLARADVLYFYGSPKIGIVYGGVNDAYASLTGTAQAGAAGSITLASGASSRNGAYVGQVISTTGGAGSGQSKTIIAYDPTTKVATVDSSWSINPNSTTTYSVAIPTQAQTQANIQAIVKVLRFRAVGQGAGTGCMVWVPALLPANGEPGQRYVVMRDNSTTGGAPRNASNQNANITGDYSGAPVQSVWEWRNPRAGESGWARVAVAGTPTFADGVSQVLVFTPSYLNWGSGGDSYNTATSTGSQFADYVPIRSAATAAAASESVTLCDVYDYQSKLIYGGMFAGQTVAVETAQGSESYHYTAGNQHYSAYGHDTVARAAALTIINAGWTTGLQN